MNTEKFVDKMFSEYEDSPELKDFKEEVRTNLDEKINRMIKKGASSSEAFKEATAELGSLDGNSADIPFEKKKEVFKDNYFDSRNYLSKGDKVAIAVTVGVLIFSILLMFLVFFAVYFFADDIADTAKSALAYAKHNSFIFDNLDAESRFLTAMLSTLGVSLVFFFPPVAALVFIGLRLERVHRHRYPVKTCVLTSLLVYLSLLIITISTITFLAVRLSLITHVANTFSGAEYISSIAVLILLAPIIAGFIALGLTWPNVNKEWFQNETEKFQKQYAEKYRERYNEKYTGGSGRTHNRVLIVIQSVFWPAVSITYVLIGILFGAWHPGWIIFPLAVLFQIILGVLIGTEKRK